MINLVSPPGPPWIFLATFPDLNTVFPQLRCPFQATRRRNLGLGGQVPGGSTFHDRAGFLFADLREVVQAAIPGLIDEVRREFPDLAVLAVMGPVHLIAGTERPATPRERMTVNGMCSSGALLAYAGHLTDQYDMVAGMPE